MKAHLCVGIKTHVIISARITDQKGEGTSDNANFIPLLKQAHDNGFDIKEVCADKAYSSRENLDAVNAYGGVPYIPFIKTATQYNKGAKIWNTMFYYAKLCPDEYGEHYHKRSNVESVNMAIKAKLGDHLKCKTLTAQTNELLCKLIAYNIIESINAMYKSGITPKFKLPDLVNQKDT